MNGMKLLFLSIFFLFRNACVAQPKLVVCLVVDQLSQSNLMRLAPFMNGGIKKLLTQGIVYHNASWPSSIAATGPNHTGLVTGTVGAIHGIIANDWFGRDGVKIDCDSDTSERAAVFSPSGIYAFGKSARNIMVDTVGDQAMIANNYCSPFTVISVSLKSRSAIAMAGHLGKAFWFDTHAGRFTSSKAYFAQFPTWMNEFNNSIKNIKEYTWHLLFEKNSCAYDFVDPDTYAHSRIESLLNKKLDQSLTTTKEFYSMLIETPKGHELVLNAAYAALEQSMLTNSNATVLLFVGLSAVDKIGHLFGADSYEYCDSLFQLDAYVQQFMKKIETKIQSKDTLFILTSDHGSMPIPELLQKKGFSLARRKVTTTLVEQINGFAEKKFGIHQLVQEIDTPNIYFNLKQWITLEKEKQKKIIKALKRFLKKQKGFKNIWSYEELAHGNFNKNNQALIYKNQTFPHRSGQLIFQVYPYVYVSKYTNGTGHKTPYAYDTHVPLIVYQPTILENKKIMQSVFVQQVACTLSALLHIPQPSAATFSILPGICEGKKHD